MDITYNRLKKLVESRHGEVTFEKLGAITVTIVEFVESLPEKMSGQEKEDWAVEALDKIWFDQTNHHIIDKDKGKGKSSETYSGSIEDLVKQLIQQVCIATKGEIKINNFFVDPELVRKPSRPATNSIRKKNTSFFAK